MGTYSQLVDELTIETNRWDLRATIGTYVNQTIRECHMAATSDTPVLFQANMQEVQVASGVSTGYVWSIPNPMVFQELKAARYDNVLDLASLPVYPKRQAPGERLGDTLYAYYRSGDGWAFKGYGGLGSLISIAWYEYLRRLTYQDSATRAISGASFSFETGWTYGSAVVTALQQTAAREAATNWMILRWYDTIMEGARAKIYKRLSDDVRGRTAYSLYMSMRKSLVASESYQSGA